MRIHDDKKIEAYLDEFSAEYRELLFEQMLKESIDIDDLNVSRLIKIDNDIKEYMRNRTQQKKANKFRRIGYLYIMLGILTFFMGQALTQIDVIESDFEMKLIPIVSLVVSIAGMVVSLLPDLLSSRKRQEDKSNLSQKLLYFEVIECWNSFESLCNTYLKPLKRTTSLSVIQSLQDAKIITPEERDKLRDFIRVRNAIVHGTSHPFSSEEIVEAIKSLSIIADHIKEHFSDNT